MNWVKNGPNVEKPDGECLIRVGTQAFFYAVWDVFERRWFAGDYEDANAIFNDAAVTHFALITEPTDDQTD